MDEKIFYLYQSEKDMQTLQTSSLSKENKQDFSIREKKQQTQFSLKELSGLSSNELGYMIFTFDKKLLSIPINEYTHNKDHL